MPSGHARPDVIAAHPRRSRVALSARRALVERAIELRLRVRPPVGVVTTVGIVVVLAVETIGFFSEVSLPEFFGDTQWTPLFADKHFGIWPLVAGTC